LGGKIGPKCINVGWRSRPSLTQPSKLFSKISEAITTAQARLAALEQQLREIVPSWTMAPVVAAY
jgi:hypothetical protein